MTPTTKLLIFMLLGVGVWLIFLSACKTSKSFNCGHIEKPICGISIKQSHSDFHPLPSLKLALVATSITKLLVFTLLGGGVWLILVRHMINERFLYISLKRSFKAMRLVAALLN